MDGSASLEEGAGNWVIWEELRPGSGMVGSEGTMKGQLRESCLGWQMIMEKRKEKVGRALGRGDNT